MNNVKLNLFVRAYKIRLNRGEKLEEIHKTYTKLTDIEKSDIENKISKNIIWFIINFCIFSGVWHKLNVPYAYFLLFTA